MTEADWLNATKPYSWQEIAEVAGRPRKLRQLMVGFLEPLQEMFSKELRRIFVELQEWAENEEKEIRMPSSPNGFGDYTACTSVGLTAAAVREVVYHGSSVSGERNANSWLPRDPELLLKSARAVVMRKVGKMPQGLPLNHPSFKAWSEAYNSEYQAAQAKQADLMRCVCGNPFRKPKFESSWLTTTVTGLAHAIHTERAFDRLPILGDALEDVGCSEPELLAHCRGPGPHVRGCWGLDLILGKN